MILSLLANPLIVRMRNNRNGQFVIHIHELVRHIRRNDEVR